MTEGPKRIIVQKAVDEDVFFAPEVRYATVYAEDTRDPLNPPRIVFVVFTPTNGYSKGKEHWVPITHVVAVVDDTRA